MNDKLDLTPEQQDTSEQLNKLAQGINPDRAFQNQLESRLKTSYPQQGDTRMRNFQTAGKALGLIVLITLFALGLNYVLSNLRPTPQPAQKTEKPFVCEVTQPNGETPPYEQPSPSHHGNGKIWTGLWEQGKVIMTDQNRESDGSYSMKWWWWRGVVGQLTIEGRRLDADAEPLRADIPDGYGDTGFQVAALIFPTEGCWEVTGRVGDDSLTFVTEVVIQSEKPATTP